jgi:hypothetical protein
MPAASRVVVEFPYKNELSYVIGPARAYPVIMKYAKENKLAMKIAYEIYDTLEKKIYYIMEVAK